MMLVFTDAAAQHMGIDFKSGLEEGISQIARKNPAETMGGKFCLNFPLEISFKTTNPHGWPRFVLSCYGTDIFGNDVVRGYGSTFVPLTPGSHTRRLPMFVPEASSALQKLTGWALGRRPELIDARLVAHAEGREVTKVRTQGFVTVTFNVITKDTKRLGYDVQPRSVQIVSEFPLSLPGGSNHTQGQQVPAGDNITTESSEDRPGMEKQESDETAQILPAITKKLDTTLEASRAERNNGEPTPMIIEPEVTDLTDHDETQAQPSTSKSWKRNSYMVTQETHVERRQRKSRNGTNGLEASQGNQPLQETDGDGNQRKAAQEITTSSATSVQAFSTKLDTLSEHSELDEQ